MTWMASIMVNGEEAIAYIPPYLFHMLYYFNKGRCKGAKELKSQKYRLVLGKFLKLRIEYNILYIDQIK